MLKSLRNVSLAALGLIALVLAYNLIWHFVYWSPAEEVRIDSNGVALAGTLIKPDDNGKFPAIVLLHGSGPEKRGDPANRTVINALRRMGVASLIYDKRGTGDSGGDFETALYSDFIDDALAALRYLESRPDIDSSRIGLYTISESGWFGPEVAIRNGNVSFVFGKVACPLSVVDTVGWEVRNELLDAGVLESDVDRLVDVIKRRWVYYIDTMNDPSLAEGPRRDALNAEIATLRESVPGAAETMSPELLPYDAGRYRLIGADMAYDTRPWLTKLEVPQYYAYGGRDVNMPTQQCVNYVESLRDATGRDITVKVYPQAGHSLLHWTGILYQGFVPGYVDELTTWVQRQLEKN